MQRNSELEERLTERRRLDSTHTHTHAHTHTHTHNSDVDIKQSRSQQLSEITSTNHHDNFPSDENNPQVQTHTHTQKCQCAYSTYYQSYYCSCTVQLTSVRTCTEDFSTCLVNLLENGRHKDTHVLFKS